MRGAALLWTSRLSQSGRIFKQRMHIVDWLPTLLTVAGANKSSIPVSIDGVDMWKTMNNNESSPHRVIVHNIDVLAGFGSLTMDNWKIINGLRFSFQTSIFYRLSSTIYAPNFESCNSVHH